APITRAFRAAARRGELDTSTKGNGSWALALPPRPQGTHHTPGQSIRSVYSASVSCPIRPRLVLVHGTRMDRHEWAAYPDLLPGAEVVAVDLPGHGARLGQE